MDLRAEALPGADIRDGFFTPVRDLFVHPRRARLPSRTA
jgi:hypothetical protein